MDNSIASLANPSGKIIVLNGAPRSGKSMICTRIQDEFEGIWFNFGVDHYINMMPSKVRPGIGLRPGGERPDLEDIVYNMYISFYKSIAVHCKQGFNVVVDIGHHENYSKNLNIFRDCLSELKGLTYYLVGVHCSINEIIKRRKNTNYPALDENNEILSPILLWQNNVHIDKIYDLIVDTSTEKLDDCIKSIANLINNG